MPPRRKRKSAPSSHLTLRAILDLPSEALALELNANRLHLSGTKEEKALRLWKHLTEGRPEAAESEEANGQSGSHGTTSLGDEPATSRKRAKTRDRSRTTPIDQSLFSPEQEAHLTHIIQQAISGISARPNRDDTHPMAVAGRPTRHSERDKEQVATPELSDTEEDCQLIAGPVPASSGAQGLRATRASCVAGLTLPAYPVPDKWAHKILRGEYVDFDCLLSECSSLFVGANDSAGASEGYQLSLDTNRSEISIVRKQQRRRVSNIATWLEAWSMYARTTATGNPSRSPELFGYQTLIAQAAAKFTTGAWLQYDKAFRRMAAREASVRWDSVEPSLWSICFTNQSRPTCYNCHDVGHVATQCPKRRQPFRTGSVGGNGSQTEGAGSGDARTVTVATNTQHRRAACGDYNKGTCNRVPGTCKFAHVCTRCGGSHPVHSCNRDK